jgi:hypothetical protein
MKNWPRRTFIPAIIALVLWGVSFPFAFLADGGWRIAGFAVWVPSMIIYFVLLVREQLRGANQQPNDAS